MYVSLNSIRLDIIPGFRKKDLCLGRAQKILKSSKNGLFRTSNISFVFRQSLYLTLYLRKTFDLKQFGRLHRVIKLFVSVLNECKKTKVTYFNDVCVKNIQATGRLDFKVTYHLINELRKFGDFELEIGYTYKQPPDPVLHDVDKYTSFQYFVIEWSSGNFARINRTGSFSVISTDFKVYKIIIDFLETLPECCR